MSDRLIPKAKALLVEQNDCLMLNDKAFTTKIETVKHILEWCLNEDIKPGKWIIEGKKYRFTREGILALAPASGEGGGGRAPSHTRMCRSGRAPPSPPPRRAPSAAQRAPSHTDVCDSGSCPRLCPRHGGPNSSAAGPESHRCV